MSSLFLWCEWICGKCGELHRARFNVKMEHTIHKTASQIKDAWECEGILIHDTAYKKTLKHKHKRKHRYSHMVFVRHNDPITKIVRVFRKYFLQFYAVKEDTLTIEVCS